MAVSKDLSKYIGQTVHTKYTTDMISKGDGKERVLKVPRLTEFTIENLAPKRNSTYVTLTLKDTETRRIYFKDVTFTNVDDPTSNIDGRRTTSQAARAAIRQGRVILNMTEDEVVMAMGEPNNTVESSNGRHDWIYNRSGGKLLIVKFDGSGTVIGTSVDRSGAKKATTTKRQTTTAKKR